MRKITIMLLLVSIPGCDNSDKQLQSPTLSQEQNIQLEKFINRIKSEMIFMPAGTFLMGDFCSTMRNGGMFCTIDKSNKPVHKVELTAFSIAKYKITHEDYDFYINISGAKKDSFNSVGKDMLADMTALKNSPAIISWDQANNYCLWLKEQTGLAFSLPTEAQWEYAARDKGKYIIIATDDGTLRYNSKTERGENFATDEDREITAEDLKINSILVQYPVDKYPPSPAGLYGMADNGKEWVMDWYDPDWYKKSPFKDPKGPEKGVIKDKETGQFWKVIRGASHPSPGRPSGLTFSRSYEVPDPGFPAGITARCVVNDEKPIN